MSDFDLLKHPELHRADASYSQEFTQPEANDPLSVDDAPLHCTSTFHLLAGLTSMDN